MLAGAFLMGSTSLVDQSMAAMLAGGSVAALSYGSKIVGAISTTGANALSTAALPYFSKMISANDWNGCRHTLKRYSLLAASVTLPLTLLLMVFSRPLVRLVFQRGAFTAADTELVTWIQIYYAIQIPFYVLSLLFVRFLSSARRNDLLMYASAINLFVDIVLNLFFMRFWGVAGIALSTSIVFLISFAFVSICSIRILSRKRMGTDGSLESAAPING
jgi:putative peptidoglycan lipid II flippase